MLNEWLGSYLGSVASTAGGSASGSEGFQDHDGSVQGSDYSVRTVKQHGTSPLTEDNEVYFSLYTDHNQEDDSDDKDKTVERFFWAYEHRYSYKHSYMLMQTTDKSYYVVEKNDLGVIWQEPYQKKGDTVKTIRDKKVEHDGSLWTRESVNLHKQWIKGTGDSDVTIG